MRRWEALPWSASAGLQVRSVMHTIPAVIKDANGLCVHTRCGAGAGARAEPAQETRAIIGVACFNDDRV
jgi:hypothetical protein